MTLRYRRGVISSAARTGALRHVCLTLAMLAVALKVLIPAGFMVASPSTASAGFPLVLCTGHGAVAVEAADLALGAGKKTPAEKPAHDAPCAFAGHAAAAPPPAPYPVEAAAFAPTPAPQPQMLRRDLAPGRGLAAPPLPARGPPILLT
jgi:hypothetical protein